MGDYVAKVPIGDQEHLQELNCSELKLEDDKIRRALKSDILPGRRDQLKATQCYILDLKRENNCEW